MKKAKQIVAVMTLEEKAGLCSGKDYWNTKELKKYGVTGIMLTDGPHGLRKQNDQFDHLGIYESVKATCFPPAVTLAATWNREIVKAAGAAIARECQAENVAVILGPGTNIKRSPLCGRNFEYFSEDPYMASEMAAAQICGTQKEGIGCSLKHFAVNNQEHKRTSISAEVDERTFREIYLCAFEGAVKQAKPWTVMCSYNKINGTYSAENKRLLTDILREEWGYEGVVVSDWGAVAHRVKSLAAGLDLEMPGTEGRTDAQIVEAVKNGTLSEECLDIAAERILVMVQRAEKKHRPNEKPDMEQHHEIAKQAALEGIVLLKNDAGILPMNAGERIAIIGPFAKEPRYQGGGSSHINPSKIDTVWEALKSSEGNKMQFSYADGFIVSEDRIHENLEAEAISCAKAADKVILLAGLPDALESEGYDRKHLRLPDNQLHLLNRLAEVNENVVVVLSNGAPLEMPWENLVKGIVEAYLLGQAGGSALADILSGKVSPSGKLAETFPKKLSDNPSFLNFPGEDDTVEYREGVFVGYRYYDKKELEPLFPFGYGLSYTKFDYLKLSVEQGNIRDDESVKVEVALKNIGAQTGKEIVQLYVGNAPCTKIRPLKELVGFEKIELEPGEVGTVTFILDKRSFAYYNTQISDWHVESGIYTIMAAASSADIRLSKELYVESTQCIYKRITELSPISDICTLPGGKAEVMNFFNNSVGDINELTKAMGADMLENLTGMTIQAYYGFMGDKISETIEAFVERMNELQIIAGETEHEIVGNVCHEGRE